MSINEFLYDILITPSFWNRNTFSLRLSSEQNLRSDIKYKHSGLVS